MRQEPILFRCQVSVFSCQDYEPEDVKNDQIPDSHLFADT
jgi:hypothetical protein